MLCMMVSLFFTAMVWPAIAPDTCGVYMQDFWSIATGSAGGFWSLIAPFGRRTSTSPSPPSAAATTWLAFIASLAQYGSRGRGSGFIFGAAPSRFTLPVIGPLPPAGGGVGPGPGSVLPA